MTGRKERREVGMRRDRKEGGVTYGNENILVGIRCDR